MGIGTSCDQHGCFKGHCDAGLLCPCECHNKLMEDGSVSYRRYPPEEAGAALVALRKTGELTCTQCGKSFTARTAQPGPRYCSSACRQKAFRQRATRAPAGGEGE